MQYLNSIENYLNTGVFVCVNAIWMLEILEY